MLELKPSVQKGHLTGTHGTQRHQPDHPPRKGPRSHRRQRLGKEHPHEHPQRQRDHRPLGGYTGRILLDGRDITIQNHSQSVACGIAMVHQELALFSGMTVTENIKINREKTRFSTPLLPELSLLDPNKNIRDAQHALEAIGAHMDPGQVIDALSLNQKQFVELARELLAGFGMGIQDTGEAEADATQPHSPHRRKLLPKVLKEFAKDFVIFMDIVYEIFSV